MTAETNAGPAGGPDSSSAFSMQVIVGLVVVGVLSFAAFIVLNAFADDLRKPEDGGTHALSKSAVGFAGIVSLLEGEGRAVLLSRGSVAGADAEQQITVLTPDIGQRVLEKDIAGAWGVVLIVLPKWDAWEDDKHPGWVRSDGLAESRYVESVLRNIDKGFTVGQAPGTNDTTLKFADKTQRTLPVGRIERLQTMVSHDIRPILTDAAGHTVLGLLDPDYGVDTSIATPEPEITPEIAPADGRDTVDPEEPSPDAEEFDENAPAEDWEDDEDYGPRVYVLSEPDLLNTKGLASAMTAKAGLQIFEAVSPDKQPVIFDMTLHGMERSRNFMKLLLEPPFLPAILCLAFAGGLMAANAVAGRLRIRSGREIALGKTTLVENSALLLSMTGRDARMGRRYAAMTRLLGAMAAGVPLRSTEAQQVAMLDAANRGATGPKFSELAANIAKAATPAALVTAANRLFRWRQEIGREHRRR